MGPGEDEADRFAHGIHRHDLIEAREPRHLPTCIRIIKGSDLDLDAALPLRDGLVEMIDELIKDDVADPTFKVAE